MEMAQYDAYFDYLMRRSAAGALYRHAVLYPRIARRLTGRTLDVGCGIGDFLRYRPQTVGVDVNPRTVEYCRNQGLDAHCMEPDRLPFADGDFQSVLLDNVLEHIAEPGPLLTEIQRVLGPHGRVLIGVPGIRGWERDPDHKVRYDEFALTKTLRSHGFEVAETFHTPLWRWQWLSRKLPQYCLFMLFAVAPQPPPRRASAASQFPV